MSDAPEEPRGHARSHSRQYQPRPLVAGILLALFVATVALAMSHVRAVPVGGTSNGSSTSTTSPTRTTTPRPKNLVVVQVANGTSRRGIAHTATYQLQRVGWNVQAPANGPTAARTVIYFENSYHPSALQIAHDLGVSNTTIQPWATGASAFAVIHPIAGRLTPRSTWAMASAPYLRAKSMSSAISTP